VVQTLEWFQCKSCGRRHRWSADIAGSEVECQCGQMVLCPELDVFDHPDPEGTVLDPMAGVVTPRPAGEGEADRFPTELVLEGDEAPALQRKRGTGFLGMTMFQETLFWMIGAAVGFSLVVHAIVVQWPVYIVLTVLWTPFSFVKFWKVKGRWQGNRGFMRAFEEELGSGHDDEDGGS
jgi:hypothetical protein